MVLVVVLDVLAMQRPCSGTWVEPKQTPRVSLSRELMARGLTHAGCTSPLQPVAPSDHIAAQRVLRAKLTSDLYRPGEPCVAPPRSTALSLRPRRGPLAEREETSPRFLRLRFPSAISRPVLRNRNRLGRASHDRVTARASSTPGLAAPIDRSPAAAQGNLAKFGNSSRPRPALLLPPAWIEHRG